MHKSNVGEVVRKGLCLGCGLCQDNCHRKCIDIKYGKDINFPAVNERLCTECNLCLKCCPGLGVDIDELAKTEFAATAHYDNILGYYLNCWVGYSTDYETRFHAASGGSVSSFLIYLLESHILDGVVVTKMSDSDPFSPITFIAKSKEEVLSAKSSKYCVVSYDGIITKILSQEGKYAVVGLPCHIHAFRKSMRYNKKLANRILGLFAIYCSSSRTTRSVDYLCCRYGIKKDDVRTFSYRDEGYLGSMVAKDDEGKQIKAVPYVDYWHSMRGFFNVPRCSLCIDHFGELADISFGDIYVDKYKDDTIGVNSIISRSDYWQKILMQAQQEGYLVLENVAPEMVKNSQPYVFRHKKGKGVAAALRLRELFHLRNPEYDVTLMQKPTGVDLLKEVLKKLCRWMGKQKAFWPLIKITS